MGGPLPAFRAESTGEIYVQQAQNSPFPAEDEEASALISLFLPVEKSIQSTRIEPCLQSCSTLGAADDERVVLLR